MRSNQIKPKYIYNNKKESNMQAKINEIIRWNPVNLIFSLENFFRVAFKFIRIFFSHNSNLFKQDFVVKFLNARYCVAATK